MKITTFNVNSLRAIRQYYTDLHKYSFTQFLDTVLSSDIICFQETKLQSELQLDTSLATEDFDAYFSYPKISKKIGYSGTATYIRRGMNIGVLGVNFYLMPFKVECGLTGLNEVIGEPIGHFETLRNSFNEKDLAEIDSEGRAVITDHG